MDLNNAQIEIRPRKPYEGLDLGFSMASKWFLTLWLLWLSVALPVVIIVKLFFSNYPVLSIFILWWLKPIYETPILYWLSRAIFNEKPEIKSILKNIFSIIRPRILSRLTLLRFSPSRSFYMPVLLLENLGGKEYRSRVAILGNNQSAGFTLTFICILFEVLLYYSAVILLIMLVPQEFASINLTNLFDDTSGTASIITTIFSVLAMSIIAPFYIASGFALYLTRRTELEAWDIELNFKRLVKRKKESKNISSLLLSIFLIFSVSLTSLNIADASESGRDKSKTAIEEVLKHKDFGQKKTESKWRFKTFESKEKPDNDNFKWFFKLIEHIAAFFSMIIKPLIWLGGGILVTVLLYLALKQMGYLENLFQSRKKFIPPTELFGLKLTKDSLPENILDEVKKLLKLDDVRGALSLLYRGALFRLVYLYYLEIPASATEGECVSIVKKSREADEIDFFKELTDVWLKMAYGHIRPERHIIEALCNNWDKIYTRGANE